MGTPPPVSPTAPPARRVVAGLGPLASGPSRRDAARGTGTAAPALVPLAAGAAVLDVTAPDVETRARAALGSDRTPVLYCRSGYCRSGYCRSGPRADRAARRLADLGSARLANAGGFDALAAAGLATGPYTP